MTTSTLINPSNAVKDNTNVDLHRPTHSTHPGRFWEKSNGRLDVTDGLRIHRTGLGTATGQRKSSRPSGPRDVRVAGLHTWTGRVVDIDDDLFTAELTPGHQTPGSKVFADFERDLVVTEREELRIGDVVYVTVRRVRTPHGLTNETSSVRLRRIGKWSSADVEDHARRAETMFKKFSSYVESE